MLKKSKLRKEYTLIRKSIPDKNEKSDIITHTVLSLSCVKKAKKIALYNSLKDEVSTKTLFESLVKEGKEVFLPKVSGNDMEFYKVQCLADACEKSSLGIYEPPENSLCKIKGEDIEVIIIPGICFDLNKNRIGFGKGYYDAYLKKAENAVKAAICFEEQILKNGIIEADGNDIKPDMIITEKHIYI